MRIFLADLIHNKSLGDNNISGGSSDTVVPLNVASIAAFVDKKFGNQVEVEIFKDPERLMQAVYDRPPALVGLSCYIWNNGLNNTLGSEIRRLCPESLIVMGGPSIRDSEAGIRDFITERDFLDVFVMFEAEWAMVSIVEQMLGGGKQALLSGEAIPNCAWIKNGALVYKPPKNDNDVDELPSPYLTGWLDPFLAEGHIPLFETNRGCPFKCSFCVWGVSALNSVRKYSLERVFQELDYVADKYPDAQGWILADANFGMLKRDIEIASRIRDIKARNPALKNIIIWESKNTNDRNVEIAKLLGSSHGNQLIAVQTLDPSALEAVQRTNIKFGSMTGRIRELHGAGTIVGTHILAGLPRETFEGQINTIRQCFDLSFDHIAIFSTILIPGSEMENADSREKYAIKTKYRVRQGNYGTYCGIRTIDSEEIIRSTAACSEEEMLFLRGVHWLVWYGWNHEFLKGILKYAHAVHGINPVDVFLSFLRSRNGGGVGIESFWRDFYDRADSEWFSSHQALANHFSQDEEWQNLLTNGYSKVEFYANATMVLQKSLYNDFLNHICHIIEEQYQDKDIHWAAKIHRDARIEVDEIISGACPQEKRSTYPARVAQYFLNSHATDDSGEVELVFQKTATELDDARACLNRFARVGSSRLAVEKTLSVEPHAFTYQISVGNAESAEQGSEIRFLERVS